MSALRNSSDIFLGIFRISIICNIISLTRGAFIHAPVVFLFNPLIIFGYSIIVKIKYSGSSIGKIPIKEVRSLS